MKNQKAGSKDTWPSQTVNAIQCGNNITHGATWLGHNDNGILFISSKHKQGAADHRPRSLCAHEALHPPSPQPSSCDLWPSRGDRSAIGEVTWKDIAINRWKNLLTINVGWKWSRLPSEKGNWPLSLMCARAAPVDAWHQHGWLTSDVSLSASEMLSFQASDASDQSKLWMKKTGGVRGKSL